MKNKGFTLIEMITVLTILSLLSIVAVTTVTKIIRDKRNDAYKIQLNSILESAISFVATNGDITENMINNDYNITVNTLITNGFVDKEILNKEYNNLNGEKVCFTGEETITVKVGSEMNINEYQKYDGNYLYTLTEPGRCE